MKPWTQIPLGELCEVTAGGTPSRAVASNFGGDIPWVKIGDMVQGRVVTTEERLSRSGLETSAAKILPAGTVLMSIFATIGRTAVLCVDAATNQAIVGITPRNADVLRPEYLRRFLDSQASSLERRARGVAQVNINSSLLKAVPVPLPPLPEQQRIAEILDKADALRAKRRAALAQLDTLTQAIFLDIFGDPISNPRGWPTVRFEQLCERVTVGIVVQPASYYVSEGVPALRSLNIRPGKIVLDDLVYFSKSDNDTKLAKTKLRAGDVVLVRSGQPGTAAVVPPELDGVNAIDILIATPDQQLTNPTFLCEFFNSAGGRDLVLSRQRGQVQKHLNVGSLNQAILPLPSIDLQCEFAARVAAVERYREAELASSTALDALFASLQHRAFRSEL